MSKDLTAKQEQVLDFIRGAINETGFPPTVREIGDHFGITVKGAYDHLKAIEKKGHIRCYQNKSRAIEILGEEAMVDSGSGALVVPLLGEIAAGVPILAEEHISDYLSFPAGSFGSGSFFALKVRGESMIDAGIFSGDVAIIRQQSDARDGEIVAALVDDEATLKRLRKGEHGVTLLPENSAFSPIVSSNVTILGILAGLFRKY